MKRCESLLELLLVIVAFGYLIVAALIGSLWLFAAVTGALAPKENVMLEPRPCSAAEAVQRAARLLADPSNASTGYLLGTGGYHPTVFDTKVVDLPWTELGGVKGCDCAGFVCWALKLPRHRAGANAGNPSGIATYDVQDDLNSQSFLGDAFGARDLFTVVDDPPLPGDVLAYPTIRLPADDGSGMLTFVGHTALVVGINRVSWSQGWRAYHELDIVQVRGANGRKPAAVATDGSVFEHHSLNWPKPEHRSWLLRPLAF